MTERSGEEQRWKQFRRQAFEVFVPEAVLQETDARVREMRASMFVALLVFVILTPVGSIIQWRLTSFWGEVLGGGILFVAIVAIIFVGYNYRGIHRLETRAESKRLSDELDKARKEQFDELDQDSRRVKRILLERELSNLKNRRTQTILYFIISIVFAIFLFSASVLLIFAAAYAQTNDNGSSSGITGLSTDILNSLRLERGPAVVLGIGILVYNILPIVGAWTSRGRRATLDQEIRDKEFQRDLNAYPFQPREGRAEQLFRRNEYELRKYYSLNLRQNAMTFGVGVFCVLAGLAIVAATFALIKPGASTPDSKEYVIAGVGAIGSIMVNFVAAIYLRMHGASVRALSEFHARLVSTHNLFLANVIAARIDASRTRERTLAEMALRITTQTPEPAATEGEVASNQKPKSGAGTRKNRNNKTGAS